MCTLCEELELFHFCTTQTAGNKHHSDKHEHSGVPRSTCQRWVKVQSFNPDNKDKRYFQVHPEIAAARALDEEDAFTTTAASAEELATAYIQSWNPAAPVPASADSLKDVQPFLFITGWAKHVEGRDVAFLRGLVAMPEKGDPFRSLINAAIHVFEKDQSTLNEVSEVFRLGLMDDESGSVILTLRSRLYSSQLIEWLRPRALKHLSRVRDKNTAAATVCGLSSFVDSNSCMTVVTHVIRYLGRRSRVAARTVL